MNGKIDEKRVLSNKKLNVMYTNADVLTNKIDLLKTRCLAELPHIVGVNEVKPKNMKNKLYAAEFNLDEIGFDMFDNNIEEEKGRGQLLFVSKDFKAKRVYMNTAFEETTCVKIDLNNQDKLLVVLIYRSPNSAERNNKLLNDLVKETCSLGASHILIMGDFNYGSVDWETMYSDDEVEMTFLDSLINEGLHQNVEEPTRHRGQNEPTILDLLITKDDTNIDEIAYNSPLGKSDHSVLMFSYRCYPDADVEEGYKLLYHKADIQAMKNEMSQINWGNIMQGLNTNEKWKSFCEHFDKTVEKNIPKVKRRKRFPIPLDEEIRKKIEEKDRMSRKLIELKKQRKRVEYEELWKKYCRTRNKVKSMSRNARKAFEQKIAQESKENPKKIFAYINSKTKTRQGIGDICVDPDNPKSKVTSDDQVKANIFSKFFGSVQVDEKDESPIIEKRNIREKMPQLKIKDLRGKLLKILMDLKPNKSAGVDKQSPRILKELAEEIVDVVVMIYEESLKNAEVPNDWLRAVIAVIFKKGKKSLAGNYRPVSLTCILCKCMEKLIRDHIIDHMKRNKLFSKFQYGFLAGRSVTLQLLYAMDKWTEALDNGEEIDCIYTDFMKAFDKVPHKRLIAKMVSYGISGEICSWVEAFLSHRQQKVVVNGVSSEWENIVSGVPQGSVLGPVLFLIFINDLPEEAISELLLYADDSKIFRVIKTDKDQEILQRDLHAMSIWADKWLLNFHPEKLKKLTISRNEQQVERRYFVGSDLVKDVESEVDLGVCVDTDLNFNENRKLKVGKATRMMGAIRRAFKFLDAKTFTKLYKSMVRCHLESSVSVWSPYLERDVRQIENVQMRATRMIPETKNLNYEERLRLLQLPTLVYRRQRGDLIELYKMTNGVYDEDVLPKLEMRAEHVDDGRRNRGHSKKLFIQRSKKEVRSNFFTQRVAPVWNSLPEEIVSAPSVNCFKNRLDDLWKDHPMKYDYTQRV